MKKGTFRGLLYREFLLSKSNILFGMSCFIAMSAICFIVKGSFIYGNLAKLDLMADTAIMKMMQLSADFLPLIAAGDIIFSIASSSVRDELVPWQRFRMSSPVSHIKFALVKYAMTLICFLTAVIISFGFIAAVRAMDGEAFSRADAGLIMVFITFFTFMSVIFHVFVMILHSTDKAGMATAAALVLIVLPLFPSTAEVDATNDFYVDKRLNDILDFTSDILPFTPLICAAVLALGFLCTAMLLKRREK